MKKLAIVGTGSETRDNAPWDDESFDICCFNEAPQSVWCKRWTALFQLHRPEIYTGFNTKQPTHWEWLQQSHGKPIYMQEQDARVPDAVKYPLEDAIALVGMRYLTSTATYALALAKLQGYEQVDMYGIEMSATEYQYQAEGYRFWIGYMLGAGVKVNFYSGTQLFNALLYGYEGNYVFGVDYFQQRAAEHDKAWHLAESNAKAYKTSLERLIKQQKHDQLPDEVRRFHEAMTTAGMLAGALAEAERYATFGDRIADRGGFEIAGAIGQRDGEQARLSCLMTLGKVEYVSNAWKQTKAPKAAEQLIAFLNALGKQAYDVGANRGKYEENIEYVNKYDKIAKANGQ